MIQDEECRAEWVDTGLRVGYDLPMPINENVRAWRKARGYSPSALAGKADVAIPTLEAIEAGDLDPPVSLVEQLACGLNILPSWLYSHPDALNLVLGDLDEDEEDGQSESPDPVTQHIIASSKQHRDLYALLTALLKSGEPKLLRAMEVNLRSLLKQAKVATVPWQSRIPGHFEPPSD